MKAYLLIRFFLAPMEAPMNVMVQTGGQGELHVTWKVCLIIMFI